MNKSFFQGARYMDDIMLFVSKNTLWDNQAFLRDFAKSECYWKPLRLEESSTDKFLETVFFKDATKLSFRLKNDNEKFRKIWRYHDYRSRLDFTTKRATIQAALNKVHLMASDSDQLVQSAKAKCREFLTLGYPPGLLRYLCTKLQHTTGVNTWREVHHAIHSISLQPLRANHTNF